MFCWNINYETSYMITVTVHVI